ncbi:hypothetical protein GOODEAATRI_011528 [Goodea atripinnis]|uniref:Glycosyltransferase family 92 protein n=1 Tax=Goodea atripinnis TaxID=208336 RepID=A0ABV0PX58_9TELE
MFSTSSRFNSRLLPLLLVGVIAVVLRQETVSYRCILLCQKQQEHISDGVCHIHNDHFGFSYGTADIMCPVPSGCDKPSHVAVVSVNAKFEGTTPFLTMPNTVKHIQTAQLNSHDPPSKTQDNLHHSLPGLVEVIPRSMSRFLNVSRGWLPEHGSGDLHYFGQIPALNDCLYRSMYQSKYVALPDVDELILPQTVKR